MIRLFVGLELPENIANQVYSLHGGVPLAKWVDKEKLHLNLCFLGNIQEDIADNIHDKLCQLRVKAFNLSLSQVGYFATGDQPHHLWVGVNYYQALDELSTKIKKIAYDCKAPDDRFKFHAHVSIASLKGTTMDDVFRFVSQNNLFKTDSFPVYYFTLFSSHARENGEGKYYRIEARYPLSLI